MEALNYLIKAHLILLVLFGVYQLTLKNDSNFKFNRFYLLAIILFSAILPLINIPIISGTTYISATNALTESVSPEGGSAAKTISKSYFNSSTLLCIAYFIVVMITLSILIRKYLHTRNVLLNLKRKGKYNSNLNIHIVDNDISPFTFFRNTFIPKQLIIEDQDQLIINHEKVHRDELHSIDILLVELLSCLLIFNPILNKLKLNIIENHEYLADSKACKEQVKEKYIELLIKQTLFQPKMNLVSYFAKPTIMKRLKKLKIPRSSNTRNSVHAFAMLLVIFVVFACEIQPEIETIEKVDSNSENIATEKVNDSDLVFTIVEEQAEPIDGIQDFYNFINAELSDKYPQVALQNKVEGVVYIQFVIEKDGSLSNVHPVKGIGFGCDEVAVEAIKKFGKWKPGRQRGTIVRSQRVVPIRFVLI